MRAGNVSGMPNATESRMRQLVPVSLLLAAGCFSPDDPRATDSDTSMGSSPSDPSAPSETDPAGEESGSEATSGPADESSAGSSGGGDTDAADSTTEPEADTTAPTVVAISPEDGATGVANDAAIVLTFSEPMDRVSTQLAWQSADIGGTTMSWNDDDTVLTLVPNDALAYATGSDVDTLEPNEYAFILDTTATDKAGNALDAMVGSHFFTLRRIELDLTPLDALTGMTYAGGSINTGNVHVGDVQGDTQQKGVLSFALRALPTGAEPVRASLHVDQTTVSGSPYGPLPALGEIHVMDVEFETNWDAWEAPALSDLGVLANDATLETKSLDVTDVVVADYDADVSNTQFRLEFPVATNGNGTVDRCTFDKPAVGMNFSYLVD
jgi:hypothetical protein